MAASAGEQAVAVRAAQVLGLGVAGVDLIRAQRGPLVLEVNSTPGLEGIEQFCGRDVAGDVIDLLSLSHQKIHMRQRVAQSGRRRRS